jgi:hypothetical protein
MGRSSVQLLLLVGVDDAVGLGVGDAGEEVPLAHLGFVQERALGLVHLAGRHLARAGGARARAAREGKLHAGVLRGLEDVRVLGGLELVLRPVRANQLHLVHGRRRGEPAGQPAARRAECLPGEADEGSGPCRRRGGPEARPGFGDGQTCGGGGRHLA